jgi:hypothetical protein
MAALGFAKKVPFAAEVSVGNTWVDCQVVWEGLQPHGLSAEDKEALEIGRARPWFPYLEQETGARDAARELAMA